MGARDDVHQKHALLFGFLERFDGTHETYDRLLHVYQKDAVVWRDGHGSLVCGVQMNLHHTVLAQKVVLVTLNPAPVVAGHLQADHLTHTSLGGLLFFTSFRCVNTCEDILLDFLTVLGLRIQKGMW